MIPVNPMKSHTEALHSCEVSALAHYPGACACVIQPAWDGFGDYVLWASKSNAGHGGQPQRRLLVHEDGAALRFPNPIKAHAHALKCGFRPEEISIRWPPEPPTATPFDA